jgi:uncharacterized protein (TIGR00661 family)
MRFTSTNGKIDPLKTLISNNPAQLLYEIFSLPVQQYDCIISDFEPVTAWAAKLGGKPVIGLGHQYAFHYDIPKAEKNIVTEFLLRYFAPAKVKLGLHWHPFGQPILPPIIDTSLQHRPRKGLKRVLVYLPFENQAHVQRVLSQVHHHHFIIYAPQLDDGELGHLSLRKTCLDGFKEDLASADAVICNAGFELISECLQMGLPILAKPLAQQMEQSSNCAALDQLQLASTCSALTPKRVEDWLSNPLRPKQQQYPDVAKHLVQWLAKGQLEHPEVLSRQLWSDTAKTAHNSQQGLLFTAG